VIQEGAFDGGGSRSPPMLYSYWRAGAPHRVRLGLALKGLAYEYRPVNLLAGEQGNAAYGQLNPQHLTPTLVVGDLVLTQSLAILEWLEETYPAPALLPAGAADRAVVRGMAAIVACDIHPLNNLRVLRALVELGHAMGSTTQAAWTRRWISDGFAALEPLLSRHAGEFAFGDRPGLADCCIAPQIVSADRFGVALEPWRTLGRLSKRYAIEPAFVAAHPENQPDAPGNRTT